MKKSGAHWNVECPPVRKPVMKLSLGGMCSIITFWMGCILPRDKESSQSLHTGLLKSHEQRLSVLLILQLKISSKGEMRGILEYRSRSNGLDLIVAAQGELSDNKKFNRDCLKKFVTC